ncbi:hypothetical protein A3D03_01980 [Candidatus Gottesmanbacteria bacterium RIFCSPHIGHO2_02_FULL_40_13]|uniref:Uncharacterized protein n=1 Tax=Candidatus Gottesmanbacteria bacterium RIFCSPHIGHO2_02_FULL_40_13 TaxID=1798384 RepID=A0A1F6ABF8_9BACT|nr:MAG: hypothetical protein A3D03_01980 [Candidatus Gottesmanbacteria bacterium RIFCSPHIGHO2_02_FULL_40_13]
MISGKIIFRDVRFQVSLVLLLIWFLNLFFRPNFNMILYPLLGAFLFSVLDVIYTFIRTKRVYLPFSAFLSGLIISLILDDTQGLFHLYSAVFAAFFSKHFIRIKGNHIFNPAAFGLFVSSVLFQSSISWWSVITVNIYALPLIFLLPVLNRLRRLHIPLIFLGGIFIYLILTTGLQPAFLLMSDGSLLFFAFVMLTEPMTTKIFRFWKYGSPLMMLAVYIIFMTLRIFGPDLFLSTLLLVNLLSSVTSLSSQQNR